MLSAAGASRDTIAAALRCLMLITVFVMALLGPGERTAAFDIAVGIGAAYVVLTTFFVRDRHDGRRTTLAMLAVDVMLITALIKTHVGVSSDYYPLYYLPILHASVRLNFRDAAGTCALAAASYFLVGILERPDSAVTTTALSRVLTFSASAGLLTAFFIILARDRRSFDELNQAYHRATQAKSEFLSRISHEFRTPLTAIVGFSQLLNEHKDELDPSQQQEYLSVIREQSQELARMIEDILDITRIDENRLTLRPEGAGIPDMIDSAMMLLDKTSDRERVAVAVDPMVPMVWVDRHEIEQVLCRLMHNALAVSEAENAVSVRAGPGEDGGDEALISVTAPGLDVDEAELSPVFGPSAVVITQRPSSGRALGLAVSRALVELHGGRIWVDDGDGAGATVNLTLPKFHVNEASPAVIVDGGEPGSAAAEAQGEDESDDRGRRPVHAEAGARQSPPLGR
jgi:signal transduction histidine kinase